MNDPLKMCAPVILLPTLSVTSSQALADGVLHCEPQDGLMTAPSGPGAAPVNLSPRQAKALGLLTSGTYGQPGRGSSYSANLEWCLANRLAKVLQNSGSTLFQLTWKEWATPSGRLCSQRVASARLTNEIGYGSLPTPTARDYRSGMSMACLTKRRAHPRGVNLNEFMQRELGRPGKLSLLFLCLMMGFPSAWHKHGLMAAQSFRKLPGPLSKRSSRAKAKREA